MRTLTLLLFTLAPCLLAEGPEFEAASIKPVVPNSPVRSPRGGRGTADPTHLLIQSMSLKNALMNAFDMKQFQIIGPDTLEKDLFEFSLVLPEGTIKGDPPGMW